MFNRSNGGLSTFSRDVAHRVSTLKPQSIDCDCCAMLQKKGNFFGRIVSAAKIGFVRTEYRGGMNIYCFETVMFTQKNTPDKVAKGKSYNHSDGQPSSDFYAINRASLMRN